MEDSNINISPYGKINCKDRNINLVIIKNLNKDCEVNSNDYLKIIKDNNILKPNYTNLNINIILIQNILCNEKIDSQNKVENIPLKEEDLSLKSANNNINLMIIKNIIPLQDTKGL